MKQRKRRNRKIVNNKNYRQGYRVIGTPAGEFLV